MDKSKIPRKKGEWILIKKRIPVEPFIQPFSIFYAIPDFERLFFRGEFNMDWNDSEFTWTIKELTGGSGAKSAQIAKSIIDRFNRGQQTTDSQKKFLKNRDIELEYRMKIRTREGNVTIEPHEYNIVEDLSVYLEPVKNKHAFIKYLNANEKITGKVGDQIFYLRSRGIGFVNAIMMTSGKIATQNAFYIEMHKEYVEHFCRDYEQVEIDRARSKNRLKLNHAKI